jgi:hypothetical protein
MTDKASKNPQTEPTKLSDLSQKEQVALRLEKLVILQKTLSGSKFSLRLYLIRLFLFQHDKVHTDVAAEVRDMEASWHLETGEILAFVEPEFVKGHLSDLADTADWLEKFLLMQFEKQEVSVATRTLCAQRFAALIYTFNILIHAFDNGNKRTSHCLAWSYLNQFDPEGSKGYSPQITLEIPNTSEYAQLIDEEHTVLSQVLKYFLAAESMECWVNYIVSGRFAHPSSDQTKFLYAPLVQASLDSVLGQVQQIMLQV